MDYLKTDRSFTDFIQVYCTMEAISDPQNRQLSISSERIRAESSDLLLTPKFVSFGTSNTRFNIDSDQMSVRFYSLDCAFQGVVFVTLTCKLMMWTLWAPLNNV